MPPRSCSTRRSLDDRTVAARGIYVTCSGRPWPLHTAGVGRRTSCGHSSAANAIDELLEGALTTGESGSLIVRGVRR
jgi:hypothetical protein